MRNRYGLGLLLVLCVSLGLATLSSAGAQTTRLILHSQPGDYIGAGQNYQFDTSTGLFTATAYDYNHDGKADYIQLSYHDPSYTHWWYVNIGVNQMSINLAPGYYRNAQRAEFANPGYPGLDVYGDGRGSNTLQGAFHILDATFDYSSGQPQVVSFAATFAQHCEGATPALYGAILYNSTANITDTSPPATSAHVSGSQVTLKVTDLDGTNDLDRTYYRIDGGDLAVYSDPIVVSGPTGTKHTVTFWSVDIAGNAESPRQQSLILSGTGPVTQLYMLSDPGDYIGQGLTQLYNTDTGEFYAQVVHVNSAGQADYITLTYHDAAYSHWWYLDFSTEQLGTALVPGTYQNAERAAFASPGHPGLDVSGDGRGSNTLTGWFQILDATFDYSGPQPRLVSFAATFEQHSEGAIPALHGKIAFNSTAPLFDRSAPTTTASLSGTAGRNGWYVSSVQVTLTVTDPDGASDVAQTLYRIDNGPVLTYSGPFTISGNKVHTLRYQSVDQWGNTELVKTKKVSIDTAPPQITASATVGALQNGQYPVTLSGKITDATSRVDLSSPSYSVQDEYGQDQPSGAISLNANGTYSFTLLLDKATAGDLDGRTYTITVQARDKAGNFGTHSVIVILYGG